MDARLIDSLVGIPYDVREMNCAHFVIRAVLQLIGRNVVLPGGLPRPLGAQARALAVQAATAQLAMPTDLPQNGDLVLMADSKAQDPGHVGVWLFVDHEPQVLHCSARIGSSRLHRMRELSGMGLQVEGVYRWI